MHGSTTMAQPPHKTGPEQNQRDQQNTQARKSDRQFASRWRRLLALPTIVLVLLASMIAFTTTCVVVEAFVPKGRLEYIGRGLSAGTYAAYGTACVLTFLYLCFGKR
jgi:uncharacterized membrane protein YdbT with pleckstrin-like domain